MNGQALSGTRRTCIIAALFAGLSPNAQLAGQVLRNEVGQVKTGEAGAAQPGAALRDCPECPEMVVVPQGNFTMGSSDSEKSWAASHGGNAESVSDESPNTMFRCHPLPWESTTSLEANTPRSFAIPDIPPRADVLHRVCRNQTSAPMGIGRIPVLNRPIAIR